METDMGNGKKTISNNALIELCRYYMEFLETDFHTNRIPKRTIESSKVIDLYKYKKLNKIYNEILKNKFNSNNNLNTIKKHEHTITLNEDDRKYILNFFKENSSIYDDNMEIVIKKILLKYDFLNEDRIENILTNIDKNKGNFIVYINSLVLLDVYDELFEMWKNKEISEKDEIYLYFYEIEFNNCKYPLFYIQLSINLSDAGLFEIEYGPLLFINKKAIQYISEKYAEKNNIAWRIDLPLRQLYLGNYDSNEKFQNAIQNTLNTITNFFSLESIKFSQSNLFSVENTDIVFNNKSYITLFDKSDESIINDYEELLNLLVQNKDSEKLKILAKLSNDFLFENPKSFQREVEERYNKKELGDKLSFFSPISLNREQLQALEAIRKDGCDKIIIQGPPGTGKSHTITAIIYDALLNKKSVLVVSDKKEALDVVEEKIEQVLEKVKLDDYLQNPILRLGKKENNYNEIFKQTNYEKIKTRYNAFSKDKEEIEKETKEISNKIKRNINDNITYEMSINQKVMKDYFTYEEVFKNKWEKIIDLDELQSEEKYNLLIELYDYLNKFNEEAKILKNKFGLNLLKNKDDASDLVIKLDKYNELIKEFIKKNEILIENGLLRADINYTNFEILEKILKDFKELKNPLFAYLFSNNKVKSLEDNIKSVFVNYKEFDLKRDINSLNLELQMYRQMFNIIDQTKDIEINTVAAMNKNDFKTLTSNIDNIINYINIVIDLNKHIPETFSKLKLVINDISSISENLIINFNRDDINELLQYLEVKFRLGNNINSNLDDFKRDHEKLENRLILKMTNILDESVVNFRETYRADAESLKSIIKKKMKIDTKCLNELIQAFPCFIVNIRDLGEYIPLEANIFDLVVIDEASQVSIAQAFPAIIRGKKVVVLGDEQQFSNVKTSIASKNVNNFLFNKVKDSFLQDDKSLYISTEFLANKIQNFNIKNSILRFIQNLANYECLLKKHFRSYSEIIGYSNQNFYSGSLQVMKIRGKSIGEVIQFHEITPYEKHGKYKNTNEAEAEYIINEVKKLRISGYKGTIGIITPFTNQQKILSNMFYNLIDWGFYRDNYKLKVMTFDSCQGDEKDIIFYSMVEKENEDTLKYIFPVDFRSLNMDEDGVLKAQRLNVGFSRAKESIRFVISKKIENFKGEIGNTLKMYNEYLTNKDDFKVLNKTDPNSPMERLVASYIMQTDFYIKNKSRLEIIPQFNIGKYIHQIDPYAHIPKYRVDFLVIYKTTDNKEKLVIIEYDGLEYHFNNKNELTKLNIDRNHIEKDIERQKTIELYGYYFLRLNKFNLGEYPVQELDKRLKNIFYKEIEDTAFLKVNDNYRKIENKEFKVCYQCGKTKPIEEFYDNNLTSGVGNKCLECKNNNKKTKESNIKYNHQQNYIKLLDDEKTRRCSQCGKTKPMLEFKRASATSGYGRICNTCIKKCPKCGAKLVKVYNNFGAYYECSNPNCDGRRNKIV